MLHSLQAKDKYKEVAMRIRDYEKKQYENWNAETEANLPLLLKKPLLVMSKNENQIQAELVCISLFYLLLTVSQYCVKRRCINYSYLL